MENFKMVELYVYGTREKIVEFLAWNDKNGTYRDSDCERAEIPCLTLETAKRALWRFIRQFGSIEFPNTPEGLRLMKIYSDLRK